MVMTPSNVQSKTFAGLQIQTETMTSGLCMGVYGTGGGGKTTLLSEVVLSPHGRPALLLDREGGSDSVKHLRDRGLDIIYVKTWKEVKSIHNALRKGGHGYKSVIWDNVSEIANACIHDIFPGELKQIQHWGQLTSRMMEFIAESRDMARFDGINMLFSLWEETERDELTSVVRKKLNLTPKFGAAMPGMVTMVGRLTVPGKAPDYIRKLSFAPSIDTDAKYRVAPDDEAANIPLELYLRKDTHFLADFLATVRDGTPFPVARYAAPKRTVTTSGQSE